MPTTCPTHCPDCAKYDDEIELTDYGCCPVCGHEYDSVVWAAEKEAERLRDVYGDDGVASEDE